MLTGMWNAPFGLLPAVILFGACSGFSQEDGPLPPGFGPSQTSIGESVIIESDGWHLVGDWHVPSSTAPVPAALLLHRAAGSRADAAIEEFPEITLSPDAAHKIPVRSTRHAHSSAPSDAPIHCGPLAAPQRAA